MTYDIPAGKYWTIFELASQKGVSPFMIKRLIKDIETIKIGQTILIPDRYVSKLEEHGKPLFLESLSYSRVSALLNIGAYMVGRIVDAGFPYLEVEGKKRIIKEHIPALLKAINEYRSMDGYISRARAEAIADRAKEFLEEEAKRKNKKSKK